MIASLAQETKTAINASLDSETSLQAVCTTQSAGITAVLNTGNIKLPASLEIEGTWTGQCICGEPVAVNMTEMTFKCIYNNGSYSYVTPTYLPLVWSDDEGTQTVTFSYTENDITVTAELSATVVAILESIAVSGTWENVQYAGRAVDTTGLSVIATFNNGRTEDVTSSATVSPSEWSDTIGTQTVTFTYTYGGRTRTATKDAEVVGSYQEVEYLEATGTQYINTGLLSTRDSTVDVVFGFTSMASGTAENCAVFGGRNNTTSTTFTLFKLATGNPQYLRFDYNGQATVATANNVIWNTGSSYRFTYNGTHTKVSNLMTGESVSASVSPASTFTTTPITLFAVNTNNTVGTFMKGRIYKYKYSDGTTTIDLIPVLDYNNRPAMYDKISGRFCYNQGVGEFLYGKEIRSATYLRSTGTQFINTGYFPNNNTKIETKVSGISDSSFSTSTGTWFFGGRQAYQQKMFGSYYNPSISHLYCGFSTVLDHAEVAKSQMYADGNVISMDKTGLYINGTKKMSATSVTTFISPATLSLFGLNNNGSTISVTAFAMHYFKVWDNNELVRDYIPAQDENGIGFMFDKVSHVCYLNKGTGEFLVDADSRLPQEYQGVAYLESTGTQWIDTGNKVVTSTDEIELLYRLMSGTQYKWFMGEHDNGARFGLGSGDGSAKRNIAYGGSTNKAADSYFLDGQHYFKASTSGVFIDGTKLVNYASFASTSAIYLFNLNLNDTNYCAESRIWRFRHKRSGVLICDLVPCYRKSDNVAGMYDLISGQFFTNAGTGTFITGQEI